MFRHENVIGDDLMWDLFCDLLRFNLGKNKKKIKENRLFFISLSRLGSIEIIY